MFSSIEDVVERFAKQRYIASRRIATVVYLASRLQKPILVEGPAGVGKTDIAKVLAAALGHELIRLQCYEGLDEAKALYSVASRQSGEATGCTSMTTTCGWSMRPPDGTWTWRNWSESANASVIWSGP